MSEQEHEGVASVPSEATKDVSLDTIPSGVIEKSKAPHGFKLNMKILGIVLFIIVAAGVGLFVYHRVHKAKIISENSGSQQKLTAATVSKDQSVEDQAMALSADGNGTDAQKLLDQELAKTTDKAAQAKLYLDKSSVAINVGQNQQALQYAQKSETISPTKNSAQLIAETSETLGNKATALKYYKLELQRMQANLKAVGPGDVQTVQDKIKELGG